MDFSLESHYTPHLSPGTAQVDAIVSVSLSGNGTTTTETQTQQRVLGFIADRSGSMNGLGRIQAVSGALAAAIDALDADTTFFVVAFDFEAEVISAPVQATRENKRIARERVLQLHAGGGTAMSNGL
jgi:Mg-chelatase subunit ChlD